MNAADVVVLVAYATLVLELVVFPIPSEASVWQLVASADAPGAGELARARRRSFLAKLGLYVLPTAIGVGFFLIPLAVVLFEDMRAASQALRMAPLVWLGLGFVVAGRAATFTSVLQLRAARAAGRCTPIGLFLWSRNPGLCGMFAFYIGLCLVCALPWMWLGLPLYFLNMHGRVRMEEAHLRDRHGDSWRAYAARVPRYLPLPGLR